MCYEYTFLASSCIIGRISELMLVPLCTMSNFSVVTNAIVDSKNISGIFKSLLWLHSST